MTRKKIYQTVLKTSHFHENTEAILRASAYIRLCPYMSRFMHNQYIKKNTFAHCVVTRSIPRTFPFLESDN